MVMLKEKGSLDSDEYRLYRPDGKMNKRILLLRILAVVVLLPLACFLLYDSVTITRNEPVLKNHCASAKPIQSSEFHSRQQSLAKTLHSLNASVYIAEPGASALYYANISSSHWGLSERPLLVAISPKVSKHDSKHSVVTPQITILAPKFEAARANLLPIPYKKEKDIRYVHWPEEGNPYHILMSALELPQGTIFVDGMVRHFIVDGLQKAHRKGSDNVQIAPAEIRKLRERKSKAEIELLKCANEATLLALRAVHQKLFIGIHESEARNMMAATLTAVGLENGHCLTLFGENAALPHGSGTDRALGKSDLALFDCTGSLHGYWSDLTRTVAHPLTEVSDEAQRLWGLVYSAQTIAAYSARKGVVAKSVDKAARNILNVYGQGKYFTHRLGHGIGLEVHEAPYLNGGSEDILDSGHTFSDEPGIYIEGQIGIRLEDCFYINDDGFSVFLTADVGGQARSLWEP